MDMQQLVRTLWIVLLFTSCHKNKVTHMPHRPLNWENRAVSLSEVDSLTHGKTYLPVYSHIYHIHEDRTFDLTITISIRNVSRIDSVYILSAEYFNTQGDKIREYLQHPIYVKPMETIEIIIGEEDREGGSGANFVFDWALRNDKNPPLFEAVMISTYGQQGLSYVTRGVRMYD